MAGSSWPGIGNATPEDRLRLKTVYSFDRKHKIDGFNPRGGVIEASDGNFYGVTPRGGKADRGTVYQVDRSGRMRTLHWFDAGEPTARLLQASDGNLYGTTHWGGEFGRGTVFRITGNGAYELVHSFDGTDGQYLLGALIQASDGFLYGTSETIQSFEIQGRGTAFRLGLDGSFEVLHVFKDVRNNGSSPFCGMVQASDGHLYGTTYHGGAFDRGGIYRLTLAGEFTLMHSFDAWRDGVRPRDSLIQASDGQLYGTTPLGGNHNAGTIFRMKLDGTFTTIHRFSKTDAVGAFPYSPLFEASDGALYGSTRTGGLYRFSRGQTMSALYSFAPALTEGGLIQSSDGALVGTTYDGGAFGLGSVFRLFDSHHPPAEA